MYQIQSEEDILEREKKFDKHYNKYRDIFKI